MALVGEIFAGPTLTVPSDREGENRFFTDRLVERPDGRGRMDAARWRSSDHFHGGKRMSRNKNSTAPAWADPDDAPDLSTPEWAAKLAVTPVRRGRPQAAKRKVSTTIRLDADIVAAFREQGEGWQTRLNAALRDWARPSLSGAIRSLPYCSVHTSQIAARTPSPACWGRWRDSAGWGCGPPLRRQTACTNVTANLRSKRPAFHTPSVAFGDTFPASRRRGRPAAACRLDDLCERRSPVGRRRERGALRPLRVPLSSIALPRLSSGVGALASSRAAAAGGRGIRGRQGNGTSGWTDRGRIARFR